MTQNSLAGKCALVTGASRGIGAAVYQSLGASGARVCGTATSAEGAETIRAAARGFDGCGEVYDAADADAAKVLLSALAEKGFAPDIVVCNAGVTADGLLVRMKDENWERVLQTNLSGAFRLARASLAGMMKKRWGRLIGISSVVARSGNAGQANYCASKAGMEGLFRAIAREGAPRGITANTVAPGFVGTDMTMQLPEKLREEWVKMIPLGRMGRPEEIAAAVVFLSSAGGDYITGQTLHINGGLAMH